MTARAGAAWQAPTGEPTCSRHRSMFKKLHQSSFAVLTAGALLFAGVAPARASLSDERPREVSFRLDGPESPRFSLLLPFRDASIERLGPLRLYTSSRWGSWTLEPWWKLAWGRDEASELVVPFRSELSTSEPPFSDEGPTLPLDADVFAIAGRALTAPPRDLAPPADAFALLHDRGWMRRIDPLGAPQFDSTGSTLSTNGFGVIFRLPPTKPVPDWRCRRTPVQFLRYGGENETFELVRCDGTTAPGALDRLSILARPPEVARPQGDLPEEPDVDAWRDRREWVDGVRVVHPRLLWALQRIADAFPRKAIYIFSGYRPFAEVNDGAGHKSLHGSGRAIDISVFHVPNEQVFQLCRELKDVGCGFYPHGKFIHVDVRRAASGKAFWIDASEPGEPAKYVDSWPGVVDSGGLGWRAP